MFLDLCFHCSSKPLQKSSKKLPEYWLLWKYEGESTLAGLMQSKEFPYNVGSFPVLFILLRGHLLYGFYILGQFS